MNITRRKMMQLLAGTVSAGYLSRTFGQTLNPASVSAIPPAPKPIPAPPGFGVTAGPFQPSWESLAANYQVPDWYRDAKFGIWAHWGPQCQPEMGDWYAQNMYKFSTNPNSVYQFHCKKYGHPSKFGFKDVINEWKADKWKPEELLALYKKAGARFFAAMANHHDNLDMWDSKYQPWNSVAVGPKKNIIGGWAKATREAGLKFALSCHASHTWDWLQVSQDSDRSGEFAGVTYDGLVSKADGKGKWWDGLDPQDLYAQYHQRGNYDWNLSPQANRGRGSRGNQQGTTPPVDPAYIEKFFNRTIDLIDKYQPDLLYFDDTVLPIYPASDIGLRIAAYLYNTSFAKNGKLEAVMTGKKLNDEQRQAILFDVERGVTTDAETIPWQTDTCIGEWHYRRSIFEQHRYKTPLQVVQMLIDIVSKNGNLMLSVPLRGDGTIDEDEVACVEGIGKWMEPNSEGIYATRPWKVYGEGPSTIASNQARGQFGGSRDVRAYTSEDFRFTAKGDTVFAFMMGWPETGKATIKSLAQNSEIFPMEIARVELLGVGTLPFTRNASGVVVNLPEKKPNDYAYTLKIIPRT
ncbi:MAG: alpha-L-fucosidase [Sedimentisphaerales bacterium]|nr:alpha-L-fucosidase [Sedimentisphaerales bacterium]